MIKGKCFTNKSKGNGKTAKTTFFSATQKQNQQKVVFS
jgi:hypothetical protein